MESAPKIFLLSPASLTGERARQLLSPEARFATARRLRSRQGVAIEEAFSFLSSARSPTRRASPRRPTTCRRRAP